MLATTRANEQLLAKLLARLQYAERAGRALYTQPAKHSLLFSSSHEQDMAWSLYFKHLQPYV
jgi:hypothetical protein